MDKKEMRKQIEEAHEMLEEVIADRIVGLLNEMLEMDYKATTELVFGPYILCNEKLANHKSVQCRELPVKYHQGERKWGVRVMGLLNGVAGIYPDGYGRVHGVFETVCRKHGVIEGQSPMVDNECPECKLPLELGKLLKFERVPSEDHQATPEPPKDMVH